MKLPEFIITINGITYDHTFDEDVRIDRTNLDEEFSDQSRRYAYYSFLAEDAKHCYERKKAALDQVYATLDFEKRQQAAGLQAQLPKFKYTEKMCENEVKSDDRYQEMLEEVHNAKKLAGQLDVASRAIAMRRDMLMQMGATARATLAPQRVLDSGRAAVKEVIAQGRRKPKNNGEEE